MRAILTSAVWAMLSFVVGLSLFAAIAPSAVDSSSLQNLGQSTQLTVLHMSYNSFLSWQVLPSVAALGQLLESVLPKRFDNGVAAVLGAVFFSGFVLLLQFIRRLSWFDAALPTGFLLGCFFWLWGSDIVLLSTLALLPWLTLALLLAMRDKRSNLSALVFLAIVSALLCQVAQHLAIFVYLAGGCLALLLSGAYDVTLRLEARQQRWIIALCILVPLVIGLELRNESLIPQYPNDAHVVSDDNVAGQVTPLVGEAPSVAFLNRKFVKSSYADFSQALLLVAILLLVALRRNKPLVALGLFSAGCSLLVVLDTAVPEAYAQIMPLFTVSRILPGAILYPLAPFCIACSLIGLVFILYRISHLFLAVILVCAAIAMAGFAGVYKRAVIENPEAGKLRDIFLQLSSLEQAQHFDVVFSPSFNLLHREGINVALQPQRYQQREAQALPAASLLALTDGVTTNPVQLLDNDKATRWSSSGGQRGGEEFCLAFAHELALSGIELVLGNYVSDFPRGIEVVKVADCRDRDGEVVFRRQHWEGPVRYTQAAYPYWGWQADVRLIFDKDITARNLKVRQLGKNKNFDWSVAEVRFYLARAVAN